MRLTGSNGSGADAAIACSPQQAQGWPACLPVVHNIRPSPTSESTTTALALPLPAGAAALPRLLGGRGAAAPALPLAAAPAGLPEFLLKGLGRMRWTCTASQADSQAVDGWMLMPRAEAGAKRDAGRQQTGQHS